ncbi:hypothetical protein SDC9_212474 [bioreactor metagenome]|uniref:Uncharacterized protein n=1 Tax=bioreactor metagenome TaxID=1076179 RepID=A0A645JM18_9ZZZZ
MIDVEALTDTIRREIGIGVGNRIGPVGFRGIDLQTDVVAATHEIVLGNRPGEDDFVGA